MSIADTAQPFGKAALFSAYPSGLTREVGDATPSDNCETAAAKREQRLSAARPPDIPGGFDFHLGVYAIF